MSDSYPSPVTVHNTLKDLFSFDFDLLQSPYYSPSPESSLLPFSSLSSHSQSLPFSDAFAASSEWPVAYSPNDDPLPETDDSDKEQALFEELLEQYTFLLPLSPCPRPQKRKRSLTPEAQVAPPSTGVLPVELQNRLTPAQICVAPIDLRVPMAIEQKEESRGEDFSQRPQKRVKIEQDDEASAAYLRQEIDCRDPRLSQDGNVGLGERTIKEEEEEQIVLEFDDENLMSTARANTTTDSPLPWRNLAPGWQMKAENDLLRSWICFCLQTLASPSSPQGTISDSDPRVERLLNIVNGSQELVSAQDIDDLLMLSMAAAELDGFQCVLCLRGGVFKKEEEKARTRMISHFLTRAHGLQCPEYQKRCPVCSYKTYHSDIARHMKSKGCRRDQTRMSESQTVQAREKGSRPPNHMGPNKKGKTKVNKKARANLKHE